MRPAISRGFLVGLKGGYFYIQLLVVRAPSAAGLGMDALLYPALFYNELLLIF